MSHPHIATAPDQVTNPIKSLPKTAIQSLYLRGSDDPLNDLTQDQEHNFLITLFYWRSPVLTALFLLCINAIAILVTFYGYNLVTLFCYIVLVQITMSLVYIHLTKLYLNFQGASPTIHEITQYDGPYYDQDEIKATVTFVCVHLFRLLDHMIVVYRGINSTRSIVSIITLFTIAQLARLIPLVLLSTWFLTGLAIVLLFRTNQRVKLLFYNLELWFSTPPHPNPSTQPQLYQQGGQPPFQPPLQPPNQYQQPQPQAQPQSQHSQYLHPHNQPRGSHTSNFSNGSTFSQHSDLHPNVLSSKNQRGIQMGVK